MKPRDKWDRDDPEGQLQDGGTSGELVYAGRLDRQQHRASTGI